MMTTETIKTYVTDHAIDRVRERLGFEPTLEEWQAVAQAIIATKAGGKPRALMQSRSQDLGGKSAGTETWLVPFASHGTMRVVWHVAQARIITVVPPDALNDAQKRRLNLKPKQRKRNHR